MMVALLVSFALSMPAALVWAEYPAQPSQCVTPHQSLGLSPACTAETLREYQRWQTRVRILGELTSQSNYASISAGNFAMGSPSDEVSRQDNEDQHVVTLSRPFEMQITEVTAEQYYAVTGHVPYAGLERHPRLPITHLSMLAVDQFVRELNQMEEALGYRYRLPTEAEWEYAARAGSISPYAWGTSHESDKINRYVVWSGNLGVDRPIPAGSHDYGAGMAEVGRLLPNAWGLYDMFGNAAEWVSDVYEHHLGTSPQTDPTHPDTSFDGDCLAYSIRGGSVFSGSVEELRSAFRMSPLGSISRCRDFDRGYANVGFRLVRTRIPRS